MYQQKTTKKSFRRWLGRVFDFLKPQDLTEAQIMRILNKMDKTDPKKRARNCFDVRFVQIVPVLHNYDEALCFLNRYGHICDTYFRLLKNADKNAALQRQLCRLRYNSFAERYFAEYPNLLCAYFKRWDLCPEVKAEIWDDEKYRDVVRIYQLFRKQS